MAATGGRAHFGTRRPVALVLRALVWLALLYCSFAAYHLLAVADAATIGFSAPIFVAAFAAGALGERMRLGCWGAVAVGARKSTRLNSSHYCAPRMPSSA